LLSTSQQESKDSAVAAVRTCSHAKVGFR